MRRSLALFSLLAAGCAADIGIVGAAGLSGSRDAPSLETPRNEDVIRQTTIPEVDILWVVDDSCSMADEQRKLGNNFDAFISFFLGSGLDWHIGVVSTDTDNGNNAGKLRAAMDGSQARFLTPSMSNVEAAFSNMVNLGTNGSPTESGLKATQRAIAPSNAAVQAANAGFYREGAALHVVVISDEEDQSSPLSVPEFVNWMVNLKASPEIPLTFSSIVTPQPACPGDGTPGTRYMNVSQQIGGQIESICVDDWYPVLEALGLQAAGLKKEYFLTELPVPSSIDVTVIDDGAELHGLDLDRIPEDAPFDGICRRRGFKNCFGFTYDAARNSVYFEDYLPGALADVSITYELLSALEEVTEEETDAE